MIATDTVKRLFVGAVSAFALAACGGGGSSASSTPAPTPTTTPTPTPTPTSTPTPTPTPTTSTVSISGKISFELVPFSSSPSNGLNYNAITDSPARGVSVKALNSSGTVLASTTTDAAGDYSLDVAANTDVRIRAEALMARTAATNTPSWDIRVLDNTSGNALYVLNGALNSSGATNSTRNLLAPSGWNGASYASTRASGPFALLDAAYDAVIALGASSPTTNFPAMQFFWSVNNRPSDGNLSDGDVGTSFFSRINGVPSVVILGAADNDTDEFDRHVVLHEFGHYIEHALARSDSIGGQHSGTDRLDARVAFGEGFGNAFSAMITNDPVYKDSGGANQASGFGIDAEVNAVTNAGWFNERSVMSILYDIYDATNEAPDTLSLGIDPIYQTLINPAYSQTQYPTSIFSFMDAMRTLTTADDAALTSLLTAQTINGTGPDGAGEANNGGIASALPFIQTLTVGGPAVQVCSVDDEGVYNKLGDRNFLLVSIAMAGSYTLTMTKTSGATNRDPDFNIFRNGTLVGEADSGVTDTETTSLQLSSGDHLIDAFDFNNVDQNTSANSGDSCYDFAIN